MLRGGAVGHNHLWFYRDAIEAMLNAGDGPAALHYVSMLEEYTRTEPLPWSELFAAGGRALAHARHECAEDPNAIRRELERVRAGLLAAELKTFLAPIEKALGA